MSFCSSVTRSQQSKLVSVDVQLRFSSFPPPREILWPAEIYNLSSVFSLQSGVSDRLDVPGNQPPVEGTAGNMELIQMCSGEV